MIPGIVGELLERVGGERVLVGLDRLEPDRLQVVDRGAEPDRLGDRGGARLELRRQLAPGRLLVADRADHVAAEQERLHLEQELGAPPEEADAARADILCPETAMKSAPSACTSRRTCGAAWAASQMRIAPRACAQSASLRVSRDRAERVRDDVRRDDLDVLDVRELVEQQVAVVVDRDDPELGAGAAGDVLPGDEVRVVLELGREHDVARLSRASP